MADAPLTPDRLAELRRLSDAERAAWKAHERCPATTPDGYVNVSGLGATGGAWGEAHAAWRAALEVSGHDLLAEVDRLRAAVEPFGADELRRIWDALVKRADICDGASKAAWGDVRCAEYARERDACAALAGRIHGMIHGGGR